MKLSLKKIVLVIVPGGLALTAMTTFHMLGGSPSVTSPDDVRMKLRRSIRDADWKGIDDAASEWIRTSPSHEEAARLRGYAALALGRIGEAEGHFLLSGSPTLLTPRKGEPSLLSEGDESSPVGLLLAADNAARSGDFQGARERVSKALDIAPSLSVARLFRASLDTHFNHFDTARDDLALVDERDPVWKEARLLRALMYLSQKQNDLAGEQLRSLVEANPPQPLALNALGILNALAGKWSEASDAFARAYSLSPQFVDAKCNWRLAHAASDAPGTVLALSEEMKEANDRAFGAITQGYNQSIAAARDTAVGDYMRDLSPFANGAGVVGAMTKNPMLAVGGSFAGDILNRGGERVWQSATLHADAARLNDRDWNQAISDIMRVGAEKYPGSPQALAYDMRLSRVQIRPEIPTDNTLTRNPGTADRGGVSAELTDPTRGSSGNIVYHRTDGTPQELVVDYPIFMNW